MPGLLRNTFWSRCILSLILLAANIGAPFRTSALVRVFLECQRHSPAAGSMVRVRAVSPVGSSQGYRALVGLAKGGSDKSDSGANSRAFSGFLRSSMKTLSHRHDDRPIARPHPFLRC